MSSTAAPGRLIGSGRAALVYAVDADRVLRRYRIPFDVGPEARMMTYLRAAGFPVPEVFDADGTDLVMTRLHGPDMLADLASKPWLALRHARTLGALHDRLHDIEAPPDLQRLPVPDDHGQVDGGHADSRASDSSGSDSSERDRDGDSSAGDRGGDSSAGDSSAGDGGPLDRGPCDRVLHMDLHPGNVMLTADGPVVIDWSNVAAGPPGADVAMATLIMRTSEVDSLPPPVRLAAGLVRSVLVRRFEAAVGSDPAPYLAEIARIRLRDPNVRPAEADRIRRAIKDQPGAV